MFRKELESLFVEESSHASLYNLIELIQRHGSEVVISFGNLLFALEKNPLLSLQRLAKGLDILGDVRDEFTYGCRFTLLVRATAHPDHLIRDGAVKGLKKIRDCGYSASSAHDLSQSVHVNVA